MIKNRSLYIFLFLTLANVFIYIFRDKFQFVKYSVYNSSYGVCNEKCLNKWKQFISPYSVEELNEARTLTNKLGIENLPTISKVLKIGQAVYNDFKLNPRGRPSDSVNNSSPLIQYNKIISDKKENIWCGNYAQVFTFFCWSQNIISRSVEIMTDGDHHSIVECYIPETKSWVVVDITNNILLAQDENGNYLNSQSFKNGLAKNDSLYIFTSASDNYVKRALKKEEKNYFFKSFFTNAPYYYYYHIDNKKAYQATEKIRRYLLPGSWYEIYSNKIRFNFLFYFKLIIITLWAIYFIISINYLLNDRNKKFKKGL